MMRNAMLGAAIAAAALACQSHDGVEIATQQARFAAAGPQASGEPERRPDVVFVPTPDHVIDEMLRMARVGPKDVVYDLGCGDGRIVVAAARNHGARAVGIDIDPARVAEARRRVKEAKVGHLVEIRQGDLFETDLRPATVVTLYLLNSLNERLKPKLRRELRPGARVVSQTFHMGDWEPTAKRWLGKTPVYLWVIGGGEARAAR